MMRTHRGRSAGRGILVILALLAGVCCAAEADSRTLLAWVCADGDLAELGTAYSDTLIDAAKRNGWSVALQLDNGTDEAGRRLVRSGEETVCVSQPVGSNSGSPRALSEFIAWGTQAVPAETCALVIFGHGTSPSEVTNAADDAARWPAVAVDHSAGGDALTPREVASAIASVPGANIGMIVLDCCYGASMETLWSLREATEFVLAAPCRLRSTGIAWGAMLGASRRDETIATLACTWTEAAQQPMTVVRTDRLSEILERMKRLSDVAIVRMAEIAPDLTLARSKCRTWGGEHKMCDLRALCRGLTDSDCQALAEAAKRAISGIDRAIVATEEPNERGAISVAFGGGLSSDTRLSMRGFTALSGWKRMAECYRRRLRELIHRTSDDKGHDPAEARCICHIGQSQR